MSQEPIYVDHSILSCLGACPEKARLSFEEGYRPSTGVPALDFGSAYHAGVAGWGLACSNFVPVETLGTKGPAIWQATSRELSFLDRVDIAKNEFLNKVRELDAKLPLSIADVERRSIERGLYLVEAYCHRYKNEVYEYLTWKDTGRPYIEIPFQVLLFERDGIPVFYCGIIDAIKRSRQNGKNFVNETKTTTLGLTQYVKHVRPNHQLTGYYHGIQEILESTEIGGIIWDCIFVSDRKGNDKADIWMARGIDMQKDFARVETKRSQTDVQEWLFDITAAAEDYITLKEKGLERWPRRTTSCHLYGGCQFRDVCSSNLNKAILNSNFKIQRWEPWKQE